MVAPSGLVTLCALNVEGSEGWATAALANTTMPSVAMTESV